VSASASTSTRTLSAFVRPGFHARSPTAPICQTINAADGSGYAFAAEQVRVLDATNPQLASTIAGAFNLWKRFAEPRRGTMHRCLTRIARSANLSPDVSEVVTRTLGAQA